MARSRDLFDDTTMTFGEHLEVLRVHVFRALLGLVLAVGVTQASQLGDIDGGFAGTTDLTGSSGGD